MDSNNTMAANLVAARGNRVTAIILGSLEENIKDQLSPRDWEFVRSLVRDQINSYKDLIIDIVKSDTAYINQLWVDKLDQIHRELRHVNGQIRQVVSEGSEPAESGTSRI